MNTEKIYRILLVDDSQSDRAIYRRYLLADQDFDYQIIEAESLEEGLELWRSQSPDLVLVDLNLPDGSGLELLAEIKKTHPRQKFPVIMMTGQGDERLAVQAMKLGASDYLVKNDITASTLCHYLETAIDQWNLSKKLTQLQQQSNYKIPQITHEHLQKIVEILPSVIFVIVLSSDGSSHFEYISKAAEKLHELSQAEILANADRVYQQIHPDDIESYLQAVEVSRSQLSLFEHKWRIITPSGKLKWIKGKAEIEPRENGDFAWCGIVEDISEQQFEIEQRQQSEYNKSIILKTMPDLLIQMDRQGKYLLMSGGTNVRSLSAGRPPSELNIYDILPQDLAEKRLKLAHLVIETGQVQIYEQIVDFGDEQQYEEVRIAPLNDQEVLLIIRDISDRKANEIKLKESQQFLQTVLEAFPLSVFWKDRESVYLGCNQNFANDANLLLPSQIIGKTDYDLPWGMTEADLYRADDAQVIHSGIAKLGIIETQLQADSSTIWLETHKIPLRNLNNEVIGILGTYQDISDRKQAEEALRISEERFRNAFDTTAVGMCLVSPLGKFLKVNPALCNLWGYSEAELLEMRFQDITHPDDLVSDLKLLWQLLAGKIDHYNLEKRYFTKEQRVIWGYVSVSLVRNTQEEPFYFVSHIQDITDRKQAEQENLCLKERLQFLLASSPAIIYGCKPYAPYNSTFMSANVESILGYKAEEFASQENFWANHLHLEDAPRVFSELSALFEVGTHTHEYRFLHQKGHYIWIRDELRLVRDEQGNPVEIVGYFIDISDRKQAEEKLRKTTNRLAIALKSGAIGSWEWDLVNNIGFWDERMYELYGVDKKSNSLSECEILATALHPDDRNSVETLLQQAILGDAEYDTEFRIVHSDSSIHFIKGYGVVVRDDQGNPQTMIGVNFDISDRKQAEAEIKEFNRRWRSVLDNIQMIVIELDLDGNVQYINPFFLKISGFTSEEVIQKHWITHFVSSDHQLSLETVFQEILEEINNEYHVNPILTKSGEERMIAWHNSVLKDQQGQSIGVISIGEDITEKHRLEQIKSEFLSIVSHELKTPLTTIQASLSLLSEKIIDPASEDGEMVIILATDGIDRLVRLVNDIVDGERLQSGKFQIKKSDCHTQKIMTDAIAQTQKLAQQENIKINISSGSFPLYADADRLVQVLINLLSNAIKFSPPSSQIDVSVEQQAPEFGDELNSQTYLLFIVRDRGRGIPPQKLEIIFERFKQIDSSDAREKEGAGLGLAISKEIVEQHGGKIWVESTIGKGSNFYFTVAQ